MSPRRARKSSPASSTKGARKVAPRPGHRARVSLDPDVYAAAWDVFRQRASAAHVARELGVAPKTAKRLVQEGVPELGLPPLDQKLREMLDLANRLDVQDGARAVAIGRDALRILTEKLRTAALLLDPKEVSPSALLRYLPAIAQINERVAAQEDDGTQDMAAASELMNAMAGALRELSAKHLPGGAELFGQDER